MHIMEGFVDLVQRLAMGDELVNLELPVQIILDKSGKLGATLDASESATAPGSLQFVHCQYLIQSRAQRTEG